MYRCPFVNATRLLIFASALSLVCFISCARKPSLSPEESLNHLRVEGDFHIELVAAEPLVINPVAMDFDENGNIFVSEAISESNGLTHSRIVLLQDTKGGGKPDRRIIFADHLPGTCGIMSWKGGQIAVTGADIRYLQDTDGDGQADIGKVLFSGYVKSGTWSTNPRYGIDNWIYVANDSADARITSPQHPATQPLNASGTDFRFQPVRGLAELVSGPTRGGMSFDAWGNRFFTDGTSHIRESVAAMHYAMRAPQLEVEEFAQTVADHANGAVTSATVYNGDAFPKEFLGNVFTADVKTHVVDRDVLESDGVTFVGHNTELNREFLTSTDPSFRPMSFANAPDGNLYVIDSRGEETGRIYRIVPNHPSRKRDVAPNLGHATTEALVAALADTNGWRRITAQRLLAERQDKSVIPLLRDLAQKSEFPLGRLHALWTLEGLAALDSQIVAAALKDSDAGVREHALRLAEGFLSEPAVINAVLALKKDPEPRVLYQLSFTLGRARIRVHCSR